MNAPANNFDQQPHAHLQDGTDLARKRLTKGLGTSVNDDVLEQLLCKTFLQSDASGRPVIRHDTGNRIVTTTSVEVCQSIIGKDFKEGWHNFYCPFRTQSTPPIDLCGSKMVQPYSVIHGGDRR